MLLDIKKLIKKDTTLNRFEYIKLAYGCLLFPIIIIFLAIIIPRNNLLYYPLIIIDILLILFYLAVRLIAIYKRINNIFDNQKILIITFIVVILSEINIISSIVSNLLLILTPGKKETNIISSNKLFWITFPLIIALLFSIDIFGFIRYITGESMANTMHINDKIVVNIFDKNFQRGDIIMHKTADNTMYIKRIVGLPGEKIEIKTQKNGAGYVYINDKILIEPYVKDIYDYSKCSSEMECKPIIIPQNNYYMLGDNRGNSYDSRYYGTVDKDLIKGKVSHIWIPFNRRQVFNTPKYN